MSQALRYLAAPAIFALCLSASHGRAEPSLLARIGKDPKLAALFPDWNARAEVQDGFLIGTGTERAQRQPDGSLQIVRTRRYTHVRDVDSGRVAALPEAWDARSTLTVTGALRLVAADTRLYFKRSGDAVFKEQKLSEQHDWLFGVDRTLLRASADGRKLTYSSYLANQRKSADTYDYPADATPLEIVGLLLSVAVARQLDAFEFELLVPGGSTHGVRAQTRRTRDLRPFAKGYRVPKSRLRASEPQAVVDLRLASPVKYVFFPHHFYLAFSVAEPWKLTALWGGDPDENLQAFRID